jgi:putative PIG3 family NAD(P)H quinone oxidoreductase
MKAVVITAAGGPEVLEIQERPIPEPSPSEIRVRVRCSALNRADISQRMGRYPAPAGSPADIPGLEYSGEVDAVGNNVTMWKPGDRVMGIVGGGSHAEFLTAHELEVMPVPREISFEDAAAIPEVFLTAYDAMFAQLRMIAGETLLIHAVGSGVGTAAVQMARVAGIRTIGTSRSSAKLERASDLGLDESILGTDIDWPAKVLTLTDGKGVDCVLDLVGAAYLQGNLDCLGLRGRLVSVGLTAGASATLDMRMMMRKRITMIGTVLRSRSHEEKAQLVEEFSSQMLPSFANGDVTPIVDSVISFDDIREAHKRMESNETFGKIVLVWR